MLKVTFKRPQGSIFWVKCESLIYDELDGWNMERFRGDSQGHDPGGVMCAPADWKIMRVEEVPDSMELVE